MLVAAFQSYGIAGGLQGVTNLVPDPGPLFSADDGRDAGRRHAVRDLALPGRSRRAASATASRLFSVSGSCCSLPANIFGTLELGRQGQFSGSFIAGLGLLCGGADRARGVRRKGAAARAGRVHRAPGAPVDRPAKLSFKLNGAGVIPTVIAAWVLAVPLLIATFFGAEEFARTLTPGQPVFMLCYAIVIVLSVYLYTAFVLDPNEAAEKLQRHGGAIPQVQPGEATAEHLDRVLSRVTLLGAVYFVTVCLIPELLILWAQVPFYLGGTSLLILVCTVLDIENQAREFALSRSEGGERE